MERVVSEPVAKLEVRELLAGNYSNKCDVWSLGVIVYMPSGTSVRGGGGERESKGEPRKSHTNRIS